MNFQISSHRTALTSIHSITKSGKVVYQKKAEGVNDLRWYLTDVWVGVEPSVIGDDIDQWRRRLRAYIRATRGHFEFLPLHKL